MYQDKEKNSKYFYSKCKTLIHSYMNQHHWNMFSLNMFLHRIKNHTNFNILTQSKYMFNNFMLHFVILIIQLRKIHKLVHLIVLFTPTFKPLKHNQWMGVYIDMKTSFDYHFSENSCSMKAHYSDSFQGVSHCNTF